MNLTYMSRPTGRDPYSSIELPLIFKAHHLMQFIEWISRGGEEMVIAINFDTVNYFDHFESMRLVFGLQEPNRFGL